jgi:hypothetical protein
MNSFPLIAQAHITTQDVDLSSLDPAFRRATPNMCLATMACQKVLETIPQVPKEQISVILGTHFGEINSSLEFLKTYNETRVARPILFQNSLHNSTLGFTTIQLGLTGPAMTISTCSSTAQSGFDLARHMLMMTPFVLLSFVDSVPENIFINYRHHMPELDLFQNQAYAFLFSTQEAALELGLPELKLKWDYFPCSI